MNNYITSTLQPILEKLASKIPVDRIFEFEYAFPGLQCRRLLIVTDPKSPEPAKTLEPVVELCLAETPDHTFDIVPFGELKTAITNGSLYYILACRSEHLQLLNGQKPLPTFSRKQLEAVHVKAKEHYTKAWDKQRDFLEGMKFYQEKKNYPQALFMLHQAVELTFRGFENAILRRDRPSHGLHEHLRLLAKYIPEAGYLFPKEEPVIYRLLKLIDQSYTAVRYQRNFEVEPHELDELYRRFLELIVWCNGYYIESMQALETLIETAVKPPPAKPLITLDDEPRPPLVTLPDQLLAELDDEETKTLHTILANLIKREALDHLILLAHDGHPIKKLALYASKQPALQQAKHCYILGIGSGSTSKSHTINHPLVRVTALLCAPQRMKHALSKKNRFFIQALSGGISMYRHNGVECPIVPTPDWALALEKAKAAWKYRQYKAETYMHCAQLALDHRKDIGVAMMLVAQSMEQLCIGLIYAATGYRVDQCNLPFLLNVCNLITPKLAECFVSGHDRNKEALKALSNSLNAVRYKKEDAPTEAQLAAAMENYERFSKLAVQVCLSVFDYLAGKTANVQEEAVETTPARKMTTSVALPNQPVLPTNEI